MSDILRRGRLASVPDEEIINFTSSMNADKWIFKADILVDLAHTIMLKERKIIKAEDCKKILEGLLTIKEEGIEKLDHTYEDIHISLESRLIDMVGEDTGGRMHSGRSRNDEVATCIRLTLRNDLLLLMEELIALRNTLNDTSSENLNTLMPGFTHLQHAQPTTLAHHLTAHANAIGRDLERTMDCYKRVNLSPLGAAAFASTGFDLDRERTCKLLGFDGLIENSMDAVSSRDFLIESASVFANLMINLSKVAEEIVIWSTSEFAFIELDDRYASTSSIMPQKKNPDTAELLRGKSGVTIGSLMSLLAICKALPLSYNRDLQEATPNIMQSLETTRASVRIMNGMIATMSINKENMAGLATAGFTTATELADTMVRVCDIPFRTAHQIVGVLARGSGEPTLGEIDAVAHNVIGESLSSRGLTEKMVKEALDPILNVSKRSVIGGPSPESMERLIESSRERIANNTEILESLIANRDNAIESLFCEVEKCIDV
ncbi:argininosuccinate lyase [Methanococcoides burtonii]|uniref:Argininosuccinate lyase n=1 Tax=Methanococcoides burtonii (strain DSM 6242 / NBRC 107633 / OCM 468 / ACE-M) TaxID=259564 RepID=ARLY_METBU|nr:argininosuccinate lyase [Methanococcoides burtonii]Q12X66.1 RecName: Full=Argininosuccinate lyase; Short=ASAL; AltName: Full=Arginosuccinase [Methanococcoides burtonii DSM 6242]ABE51960.1 Argininosuccinate lyase [Methanococcoides burtonii DSM 6242]